jgi:crossover junction endonuclease MUS81
MSFNFIIDNRETYIKEYFNSYKDKDKDKFKNITYKNLDLGDIIITLNDIPLIIIERKTIPDLLASIKDGRYKEQKQRIKECGIKYKIYLIEDDSKYKKTTTIIEHKTIVSSVLSILIQEINVIKTRGFSETIEYIETLYRKLVTAKNSTIYNYIMENLKGNEESTSNNDISINNLSININVKKKSHDPLSCFKNQLCQIPGISNVVSSLIIEEYKNMNELLSAYNSLDCVEEEKYKLLENLSYEKNGKTTRIGPKKSQKIFDYLYK